MASLYQKMQADVGRALAALGQPAVFSKYTRTSDLVSGTSTEVLVASQTLSTAVLPSGAASNIDKMDIQFIDGVGDLTKLRLAIVSAAGATFELTPKCRVVLADGLEWNIVGSTTINVDGVTDVVYLLGLQR